jgi:hypothetical protein
MLSLFQAIPFIGIEIIFPILQYSTVNEPDELIYMFIEDI